MCIIDLETVQTWQQNNSQTSASISNPQFWLRPCWLPNSSNERNVGFTECSAPLCETKALLRDGTIQGRGDIPPGQSWWWWWWWSGSWNCHRLTFSHPEQTVQQLWLIPLYRVTTVIIEAAKNTTTTKVYLQITSCQFKCHECAQYNTKQWWTVTKYVYWSTWGTSTLTIYIYSTCYSTTL